MFERVQRQGLRALRALPSGLRERLVRATSPKYTLGTMCRIEHDDRVLLVETQYRRGWGYPGGLLDRGELPADGGRREVREEVGLEVELVGDPVVIVDAAHRLVDFLYRARLAPGVAASDARAASVEIKRVEWVPAEFAIDRAEVTGEHVNRKLRYFDTMPDGGIVFHDPGD